MIEFHAHLHVKATFPQILGIFIENVIQCDASMLFTEVPSLEAFSPPFSKVYIGYLRYFPHYLGQLTSGKIYTRKDLWTIHIMGLYYHEILGIAANW